MTTDPPWEVRITDAVQKDVNKHRTHAARIRFALTLLETEPLKGHALTGKLHGARALRLSVPGTAFRIIYAVYPDARVCLVFMVGPHENIYRDAERRYTSLPALDAAPEN